MSFKNIVNKLVVKLNNIPKQDFVHLKNVSKNIKMPQKAKYFDYFRVSKDFSEVDIFSFRDKKGNIIKKFFIEGDLVTERTYIPLKKTAVFLGSFLPVVGRKISTISKENGKIIHKSEEVQAVTKKEDGKPVVNISKIESVPMGYSGVFSESQSLYQYESGLLPKGYRIFGYVRNKLGHDYLNDKPEFSFENIDPIVQQELENNKYFPLHLYSFKQFQQTAPNIAIRPGRSVLPQKIRWINDDVAERKGFYDGIQINLNKKLVNNRFETINTSAHEKEHVYQAEQVQRLNALESNSKKVRQIIKILEKRGRKFVDNPLKAYIYREDFNNYIDGDSDRKGYSEQLIEREARLAGALAEREYRKSAQFLKDEFPYAPDYMIGFSDRDEMIR